MPVRGVSPVLRSALRPRTARCYRHCQRPVRVKSFSTSLPGYWQLCVCPGGAVSVTSYVERSDRDPTKLVWRFLQQQTLPTRLVKRRDLRSASRHGPELGRPAERFLARTGLPRALRVVYWRVYPFRGRDGAERRLFVCQRHGDSRPIFYADLTAETSGRCPVCANQGDRGSP
jgi:hypothetical protein